MYKHKKKRAHNTITWHNPDTPLTKRLNKLAAKIGLSRSKLLTLLVSKVLTDFESGKVALLEVE